MEDIINPKTSLLKTFVSLANVTAKLSFLTVCLASGVLPKGMNLKFSLQTGLSMDSSVAFQVMVTDVLSEASFRQK